MNLETLRIWRNLFLRAFAVGIGLTILFAAFVYLGWEQWMPWASELTRTHSTELARMITELFVTIRFYLMFVLLTPGLALHWTYKRELAR